jgi:hypothetical protein
MADHFSYWIEYKSSGTEPVLPSIVITSQRCLALISPRSVWAMKKNQIQNDFITSSGVLEANEVRSKATYIVNGNSELILSVELGIMECINSSIRPADMHIT